MNWRHQRVLVTGGTGFLGYHLTRQLLAAGARVRVFALPAPPTHPLAELPIETSWGDIRDPHAVRRAVDDCDIVFHAAGNVAVWGPALDVMHAVHGEGTRNVLAAIGRGVRLVHTSSIVAVGATRGGPPLDENSPFTMGGVKIDYVRAKRHAEELALASDRDVVVVNPGYLIGPEDLEPSVMGRFAARVWKGRMVVATDGGYNLVDVRDVAAGHLLAAEHGRTGRRYILGGENRRMPDFIRLLASTADLHPRALPRLPYPVLWSIAVAAELRALKTAREPYPSFQHVRLNRYDWFAQSDRAVQELGYSARSLSESVRDTLTWFRDGGGISLRGLSRWWMRPAA